MFLVSLNFIYNRRHPRLSSQIVAILNHPIMGKLFHP
nr:MAG TPA: hypothetical protein [Bacteriophage sp.]